MSLRTTSISPDLIPANLREKGYIKVAYITAAFRKAGLTPAAARSYTSQYLKGSAGKYILKKVAAFEPVDPEAIVASSSPLIPSTVPKSSNRVKSSEPKRTVQVKKEKAPLSKTHPKAKTAKTNARVIISGAGSEVTTSKANVRTTKKNENLPKSHKPVSTETVWSSPRMLTTEETNAFAIAELERECARFERTLHREKFPKRLEAPKCDLVLVQPTLSPNKIGVDIFSIRMEHCPPRFRLAARNAEIETLGEVIDACTENGMSLNSAIITAKDIAVGDIYKFPGLLTARAAFALEAISKKPTTPVYQLEHHRPAGQALDS